MNRTFKVEARHKPKDEQPSWRRGSPLCVAKKRIYTSLEDFEKYSPKTIKRYKELYMVEVLELIDGHWIPVK